MPSHFATQMSFPPRPPGRSLAKKRNRPSPLSDGAVSWKALLRARSGWGSSQELPFHFASKAVKHLGSNGEFVEPQEPNAVKFERFIFDILPRARRSIVTEVSEQACYSPLKNATGLHSPDFVRNRMAALHRDWVRAAGVTIDDDVRVEISPLFARNADELAAKLDLEHISTDVIFRE